MIGKAQMVPAPLTSRMRKTLEALRSECDYEDHHKGGVQNFILRRALPHGAAGPKTLADLMQLGMIEEGPSRWTAEIGYRITKYGRQVLEEKKG